MHESEESTGLIYRATPRLKVYATVAAFRNSTGEPGWVAASTRGRTIQMQPSDVLQDAGTLDSTIHHELLHMLIESYARPGTPQWFREGLVLYLTKPNSTAPAGGGFEDTAAWKRRCALLRVKRSCDRLTPKRAQSGATRAAERQRDAAGLGAEWIAR